MKGKLTQIFEKIGLSIFNTKKGVRAKEIIANLPDPELPEPELFIKERINGYNVIDWQKLKEYAKRLKEEREKIGQELREKAGKSSIAATIFFGASVLFFFLWVISFVKGGSLGLFIVFIILLIISINFAARVDLALAEIMQRPDFPKEYLKLNSDYFEGPYKFSLNPAYDIYKSLVKTQTIERVDAPHQIIGMVQGNSEERFLEEAFNKEADALVGMSKDVQYHTEIKSLDYNRFTNRMSANTRTTKSENFQATGVKILPTEQTKNDATQ